MNYPAPGRALPLGGRYTYYVYDGSDMVTVALSDAALEAELVRYDHDCVIVRAWEAKS